MLTMSASHTEKGSSRYQRPDACSQDKREHHVARKSRSGHDAQAWTFATMFGRFLRNEQKFSAARIQRCRGCRPTGSRSHLQSGADDCPWGDIWKRDDRPEHRGGREKGTTAHEGAQAVRRGYRRRIQITSQQVQRPGGLCGANRLPPAVRHCAAQKGRGPARQ